MKKHSQKFLLSFSLAISLSGCSGQGQYLSTWTTYLHTSIPPQPSQETCSTNYLNTHPAIAEAEADATRLYLLRPIENQQLKQYIIRNWNMAAFGKKTSVLHQEILNNYQNLKKYNNYHGPGAIQGMKQLNQLTAQYLQADNNANQAFNQEEQLSQVTTPRISAYNKAVAEAKNGNYADLIAIYAQFRPQKWRNFMVSCLQLAQQTQQKVAVIGPSYAVVGNGISGDLKMLNHLGIHN